MSIHELFYTKRFQDITQFGKESEASKQVEFIEESIPLKSEQKILDLACGYGRHSILLAKKKHFVTGYDLSVDYIGQAKQEAKEAKIDATFCRMDMRSLSIFEEFDVVLSLSTSLSFYNEEVNKDIFRRIYRALKPGGVFFLDQGNISWAISMDGKHGTSKLPDGRVHHFRLNFDAKKSVLSKRSILEDKEGREESGWDIRYYSFPELDLILKDIGFSIAQTYGDYDSSPYRISSRRVILISDKPDFSQPQIHKR